MKYPARLLALFTTLLAFSAGSFASPLLRCDVKQGGKTYRLESTPGPNPYTVPATDIGDRFRFKAVVIGDKKTVEYVKIYVYYRDEKKPVLLHSAQFLAPSISTQPLTGVNFVYAPGIGYELQYECSLFEMPQ